MLICSMNGVPQVYEEGVTFPAEMSFCEQIREASPMEEIHCCHPYGMGTPKLQMRAVGGKFIYVLDHGMEEESDRLPSDLLMGGGIEVIVHSSWEKSWEVEMIVLGNTKHIPHRKRVGFAVHVQFVMNWKLSLFFW